MLNPAFGTARLPLPPLKEAKANTTDVDKIIRDTIPTTLGGGEQARAARDHEIHAAESLATAIDIFDEANVCVVEAQTRMPRRAPPLLCGPTPCSD